MLCKCGFPIDPPPRTMSESFFGEKRIIVKHELTCPKCKKINVVKG